MLDRMIECDPRAAGGHPTTKWLETAGERSIQHTIHIHTHALAHMQVYTCTRTCTEHNKQEKNSCNATQALDSAEAMPSPAPKL